MDEKRSSGPLTEKLGLDGLKDAAGSYASSLVNSGIGKVGNSIEALTGKLNDFSEGKASAKDKAKGGSTKAKAKDGGLKGMTLRRPGPLPAKDKAKGGTIKAKDRAKPRDRNSTLAGVGSAFRGIKEKVKDRVSSGVEALTGAQRDAPAPRGLRDGGLRSRRGRSARGEDRAGKSSFMKLIEGAEPIPPHGTRSWLSGPRRQRRSLFPHSSR